MKSRFILFLFSIILFVFASCASSDAISDESYSDIQNIPHEMQVVYKDGECSIFVHSRTKVMYLFIKCGYSGGLSVMLNEDGLPLLWEENLN